MAYALLGIPFTLILLRDWSRLIAKFLSYPGIVLLKVWDFFRFCTLKSVESVEDLKSERVHLSVKRKLFQHSVLRIPTIVAFLSVFGCILAGAFSFCVWETEWSTLVSFHFCFASLTTIGPTANALPQDSFMLACMLAYIYLGLAIVSLFIDFVYAKVLYAYTPADQFYPALSDFPQFPENTDYTTLLGNISEENLCGSHVSTGARTLDIDDYESSAALGSCVTLGVLQMNRRLHEEDVSRKRRQRDSKYCQTTISVPVRRVVRVDRRNSLKSQTYVASSIATSSSDDVNRLIRESYSYGNRSLKAIFHEMTKFFVFISLSLFLPIHYGQEQSIFDPNLECSPEEAEVTRANVYFRCRNKTLKAAGCLGHDMIRVPINETYKAFGNYDMLCKPISEYWAQLVPLTCWSNNLQYKPGETFVEGTFWFTCENKEKILPGQNYRRGNFVYTCVLRPDSTISVEPKACIYNGAEAKVGEQVKGTNFMFTCMLQNNHIGLTPSGCVVDNRTVALDQQFKKNGFLYKCAKKDKVISHTIVGCVQEETGKAYSIGQKWVSGQAPYRFIIQCVQFPSGFVYKQSIQCAVDHPEGRAVIDPGCMRKVGKQLIQCYSPNFGGIGYTVRSLDEPMVEKKAAAYGLKFC
uniref:Abnormal cell migration protein 18-like fibronectin type I domain-containing protein n=1 Tax=Romanomermis culicivorax TaxID=13658 RepID=A0A915KX37_ROMCU